jgi:hypothetical protein
MQLEGDRFATWKLKNPYRHLIDDSFLVDGWGINNPYLLEHERIRRHIIVDTLDMMSNYSP